MNTEIKWSAPKEKVVAEHKGFSLAVEQVDNDGETYWSFHAHTPRPYWACYGQARTIEAAKTMCIAYADMIGECE